MNNIPNAEFMPLGRMINTAEIVRRAENRKMAGEGMLLQAAAGSIMTKEGGKHFRQMIKRLMNNG